MSVAVALVGGLSGVVAGALEALALWAQAAGRARAASFMPRVIVLGLFVAVAIRARAFAAPMGWALGLLTASVTLMRRSGGAP